MAITVRIPSPLLKVTKNNSEVKAEGATITELFENIEKIYPGLKERLYDENNSLRKFINIYINEDDIRFLDGENSSLKDGDSVSIIPAIAGGK